MILHLRHDTTFNNTLAALIYKIQLFGFIALLIFPLLVARRRQSLGELQ